MDHVADQATQGPGGVRERVDVDGPDERRGAALDRWRVPTPSLARHQPAKADHLTSAAPTNWRRAAKLPRSTHVAHPFRAEGAERNGLLLRVARRGNAGKERHQWCNGAGDPFGVSTQGASEQAHR